MEFPSWCFCGRADVRLPDSILSSPVEDYDRSWSSCAYVHVSTAAGKGRAGSTSEPRDRRVFAAPRGSAPGCRFRRDPEHEVGVGVGYRRPFRFQPENKSVCARRRPAVIDTRPSPPQTDRPAPLPAVTVSPSLSFSLFLCQRGGSWAWQRFERAFLSYAAGLASGSVCESHEVRRCVFFLPSVHFIT